MLTSDSQLKLPPAILKPSKIVPDWEFVSFRHPANGREFLRLDKVDSVLNSDSLQVHSGTALSACSIVACNKPSFFSLHKDRGLALQNRIQTEFFDVEAVFYHLEEEPKPAPYPICTRFQDWKFPHNIPLPDWEAVASKLTKTPEHFDDVTGDTITERD